jgi:hypothetical protein
VKLVQFRQVVILQKTSISSSRSFLRNQNDQRR